MKTQSNPYLSLLTASLVPLLSQAAMATDILWSGATTGTLSWNTDSNWTGGAFVNSTSDRADLRKDWTTSPIINLSAPVTVNGILSDDTGASGDTTLTVGNGSTAANTLTLGGTTPSIAVTGGSTLSITANLQSAGFTKSGNGFLLLSGNNSISGDLVVSEGMVVTGSTTAFNSGTTLRVDSGATLRVNNATTVAGLTDNAGSGGSIANASGGGKTLTIGGAGTSSFNGNFTTGGANKVGLLISGTATQILSGNNTANTGYQSITGSGGTLVFAKQNSIFQGLSTGAVVNAGNPANVGISVSSGGTMALGVGDSASGYFDTTAIGTFLNASHMGSSTDSTGFRNNSIIGFDTTNATGGNFTYSTALTNIGSSTGIGFAKLGTGTLVLDAANTYGGVTHVRAGTLVVNGDQSLATGNVTVNAGATLKGNGTIGGATTVSGTTGNSAIHAPGTSVGKQTIANDLSYGQDSIFEWELAGNTTTDRGTTGFDAVDVTGAGSDLAIDAAAVFKVVLNSAGSTVSFSDNTFWGSQKSWQVFSVGGATTGGFANFVVTNDSIGNSYTTYYPSGGFTYTGSTLSWTPVPEVSNLLAGGLLGAGLLRRRRSPGMACGRPLILMGGRFPDLP